MSGTNPVFLVRRAKKQSGNKDAVLWCSDDFEAVNATLDYLLIKTGAKLKDYFKAVATNFPVVNELPPEGELSLTFCDFYHLRDDNMTWEQIPGITLPSSDAAAEARQHIVNGVDTNTGEILEESTGAVDSKSTGNTSTPALTVIATMPFRHRVLAQFIGDGKYLYHVDAAQKIEIVGLEMDTDESYIQNLLLAAENVEPFKKAQEIDIHRVVNAVKKAFPVDGKIPELATLIQFLKLWFATDHIDRGILVREWAAGNRISSVQRTDSGTNADGGYVTDRGEDAHHTLDTLDLEIACALLPMDFNHFEIPGSILRRAKEIVTKKEEPWKSWSSILRNQPGVLGVNRTAIFNLVRIAPENIHLTPVAHLEFVNQTMTAAFNSAIELLPLHEAEPATQGIPQPESKEPPRKSFCTHEDNLQRVREEGARHRAEEATAQPQKVEQELVKNVGNGIFDVTALLQNSATHGTKKATETTSNVQVQETVSDEKQAGDALHTGKSSLETGEESDTGQQADVNQNTDSVSQNSDSVNQTEPVSAQTEPEAQSDEPAVVYPAFFEPGRYEGLPNEVYHAANGISSTQVKDARVSLMYYHARHVIKTIRRDSSDALTFGSLVHTISLEPEKLHEEFAVFPGVPAEAFTNTDSLKAFIREYNSDKPKAEQLKLTGKKEELQEAIRAVKPDAVFADEFEQQWRDSVAGKTILSSEQLELATAIQQALFSNSDANSLLCNPERQSEVSYFGIDEETGLEIRVRPDIELRTAKDNICADLKTISIGNVRQDRIKERLHREIIDRDYHLSAAMYCDVAGLDSFSWIFVNKEPGYHWVAVVQASEEELELGRQEYRRVLRQIYDAMESDVWPAPIIGAYTDELNDYDLRRLQALAEE